MSGLPNGWVREALENLIQPKSERISPQDRPNAPYIGLEHVQAHTNEILGTVSASSMSSSSASFNSGEVLYGRMRPYLNKVVRPQFSGLASAEFIVFPKAVAFDSSFLLRRLSSTDFVEFACSQYEGDRPRVKFDALGKFQIDLPPKSEQTRIVAKLEELLSDLDAGVTELKAAQKKLTQYRQSLLKAAVDGSLTAEWRKNNPPTETGAQLLERILKERRARWEEKQLVKFKEQGKTPPKDWQKKHPEPVPPNTTDLSALPTSWAWASLDQSAAERLIGLDRGQEQQSSSAAFGYIKMNNVSMNGHVDVKNITRVNATQEEVDKYAVALNDVLFNTRNSLELVGKTGLVSDLDGVTLYNNNLMRLRFDGVLKPAFACFQMCGPEFRARLERVKKATTSVAAVYAKDLFPLAIAVPPIAEQTEILRILDLAMAAIDAQQLSIERSFKQAAAQRQNILRAAFAGELVPQDPNDEPASVLLERIRAERAAQPKPKNRGRNKVAA